MRLTCREDFVDIRLTVRNDMQQAMENVDWAFCAVAFESPSLADSEDTRTYLFDGQRLRTLAEIGALNCFAAHRRDALWEVEKPLRQDDLFEAPAVPHTTSARSTRFERSPPAIADAVASISRSGRRPSRTTHSPSPAIAASTAAVAIASITTSRPRVPETPESEVAITSTRPGCSGSVDARTR